MKKSTKTSILIFAAAVIVLLPLRIFQYSTILEPETGFYKSINWSVFAFAILTAGALLSFLVISFLSRKSIIGTNKAVKNPGFSLVCFVAGVLSLINVYQSFNYNANSSVTAETQVPSAAIAKIAGVFAFLSAVYFILVGIEFLNSAFKGKFKLLSLSPVIWTLIRLVLRFTRPISYFRVSELFINMLMLVFFALFFMDFAQLYSKIDYKGIEWKVKGYGFCGALMAFISFVPPAVLNFTGHSSLMYSDTVIEYCDIGIALFIIGIILFKLEEKD